MHNDIPTVAFLLGSISSHGGIERATTILADQLVQRKLASVHAIGFHPRRIGDHVYSWNEEIQLYELLSKPASMKKGIFKAIPKLRGYLREHNIDVLIACGHLVAPLAGIVCMGLSTKMIYWSHSSFYGEPNAFKRLNEIVGGILSKGVVSLTKADIRNYKKKAFANNVVQIYNPLDPNLHSIKSNYDPDTKKIVSVGRLADPKNFDTYLLEVANMVLKEKPDYTWHIYGKGQLESKIRSKIKELGLEGKVILEGNVSNLYELYPKYSIMVMTSSYEGFPMTLLEGMKMAFPLVSFDVPTGPNEIIQDGINGCLVPPFSCAVMADRIIELIENKELRITYSKANLRLIENFNVENTVSKWGNLLNNTLD